MALDKEGVTIPQELGREKAEPVRRSGEDEGDPGAGQKCYEHLQRDQPLVQQRRGSRAILAPMPEMSGFETGGVEQIDEMLRC